MAVAIPGNQRVNTKTKYKLFYICVCRGWLKTWWTMTWSWWKRIPKPRESRQATVNQWHHTRLLLLTRDNCVNFKHHWLIWYGWTFCRKHSWRKSEISSSSSSSSSSSAAAAAADCFPFLLYERNLGFPATAIAVLGYISLFEPWWPKLELKECWFFLMISVSLYCLHTVLGIYETSKGDVFILLWQLFVTLICTYIYMTHPDTRYMHQAEYVPLHKVLWWYFQHKCVNKSL